MTSIAPWLSVHDATQAAEYYKAAFGAVELERLAEGGEVMVAQLSIDGAEFWIQHEPSAVVDGSQVRMILTVADPDSMFVTAIAVGARPRSRRSTKITAGGLVGSPIRTATTGRSVVASDVTSRQASSCFTKVLGATAR